MSIFDLPLEVHRQIHVPIASNNRSDSARTPVLHEPEVPVQAPLFAVVS